MAREPRSARPGIGQPSSRARPNASRDVPQPVEAIVEGALVEEQFRADPGGAVAAQGAQAGGRTRSRVTAALVRRRGGGDKGAMASAL